jgi:hypothetical protein
MVTLYHNIIKKSKKSALLSQKLANFMPFLKIKANNRVVFLF